MPDTATGSVSLWLHRRLPFAAVVLLCGCATTDDVGDVDTAVEIDSSADAPQSADQEQRKDPLLDRTQQTVYNLVNNTSKRFDTFFGATDVESDENVSRGRLTTGYFLDRRDGSKTRVGIRARLPLPALRERGRFIFGRGDFDNLVDGTESEDVDTLPERFDDFDDDDWLLGVGYNRQGGVAKGWDFGVGVRLKTPLEPYVRATYRWNRSYGESWMWRVHPRVFWQNQRGTGVSLTNILDYAYNASWLLRSWTILQGEDEIEGLGWTQRFLAYQNLHESDAMSYSVFATGETNHEVPLQNYGIELRYRRQVAREWFFIIFSTRLDWPRELLIEKRESNFGAGIAFEMQFGDWPGRKQKLAMPEVPAVGAPDN